MSKLLELTERGLYCSIGDFYIDPWKPVDKAVISHAHSDHAKWGMNSYLAHPVTNAIMRHRIGPNIVAQDLEYGQSIHHNGVKISLYPAGHIPGSAQVRIEYGGEVWVFSGDYKLQVDRLSTPFESVPCHTFITECTFGLPVYQWKSDEEIFESIYQWYQQNRSEGKTSVLIGYSLGKAQRLIKGLHYKGVSTRVHKSIADLNTCMESCGIQLPSHQLVAASSKKEISTHEVIILPPSLLDKSYLNQHYGDVSVGYCSGWMQMRGAKTRMNVDRGFVVSDHADWKALNQAVIESGASQVWTTHGFTEPFAQWLTTKGIQAMPIKTEYASDGNEVE
jgi:putative mRNA 3-end processing factor